MTIFSKTKDRSSTSEIFISMLISGLTVLVFLLSLSTHYVENDDVLMSSISSGSYSGQPSEYLVFTNFLIGWVLKILPKINNEINWYTVYLYLTHTVSLAVFFYCFLLKSKNLAVSIIFFFTGFALISANLLQDLQFTTTAATAGVSGLCLLILGREHFAEKAIAILLIIFSSLIRYETTVLILLSAIPVFFVVLRKGQKNKIIGLSVALLGIFICHLANKVYYQSNVEWSNFLQSIKIRQDIQENKYFYTYHQAASTLKKVAWSEDDFYLFKGFTFDNSPKYSLANLEKIAKTVNEGKLNSIQNEFSFSKFYNGFVSIFLRFKKPFLLSVILLALTRKPKKFLFFHVSFFFTILILSVLDLFGYPLKERVIQINLLSTTLLCLFTYVDGFKLNWVIGTAFGLFFFYSVYLLWIKGLSIKKERITAEMAYNEVLTLSKNKLTVISHYVFKPEALSPFKPDIYPYHFYVTGWVSGIPFNHQKIKKSTGNIESKNLNCLSNSSQLQWIFNSKIGMNTFLQSLLEKNYILGHERKIKLENSNSGIYLIE